VTEHWLKKPFKQLIFDDSKSKQAKQQDAPLLVCHKITLQHHDSEKHVNIIGMRHLSLPFMMKDAHIHHADKP